MAGQYQTATHHLDAAIEQVVLRDHSDKDFGVGGQVEIHCPCKSAGTGITTAVGIGRLKSSVGGESRLIVTRLGGGAGISPGER